MRYEFKTTEGRTCCAADDPDHLCEACRRAAANAGLVTATKKTATKKEVDMKNVPDAYTPHLSALRAASGEDARHAEAHADDETKLEAMAEFRDRLREQALQAALKLPPAKGDVYANPPDPYFEALKKREAR